MGIKKAPHITVRGFEEGGDLLSHLVAVPSALTGLTSLFGMVRGGPRRHGHLSFESAVPSPSGRVPLAGWSADFPEGVQRTPQDNILTYGIRSFL